MDQSKALGLIGMLILDHFHTSNFPTFGLERRFQCLLSHSIGQIANKDGGWMGGKMLVLMMMILLPLSLVLLLWWWWWLALAEGVLGVEGSDGQWLLALALGKHHRM